MIPNLRAELKSAAVWALRENLSGSCQDPDPKIKTSEKRSESSVFARNSGKEPIRGSGEGRKPRLEK